MTAQRTPESLGSIIHAILAERGYLTVCKEYEAVNRWAELVGPNLASHTECTKVEDGVLYVRVASAAWRQEISYLRHMLLDTIRKETGCTTIRDIVLY